MGSIDLEDEALIEYDNYEDEGLAAIPESLPPLSPIRSGGGILSDDHPLNDFTAEGREENILDSSAIGADGKKVRRVVNRKPQPKLDDKRLTSDRGIPAIKKHFEHLKFQGKGHEVDDLNLMMSTMEHWAHRLFPKLAFDDMIEKIEKLGRKKSVQVCVKKLRLDMPLVDDDFVDEVQDEGEEDIYGSQNRSQQIDEVIDLTEDQRQRMEENKRRAMEKKKAKESAQREDEDELMGGLTQEELDSIMHKGESKKQKDEDDLEDAEMDDLEELENELADLRKEETEFMNKRSTTKKDLQETGEKDVEERKERFLDAEKIKSSQKRPYIENKNLSTCSIERDQQNSVRDQSEQNQKLSESETEHEEYFPKEKLAKTGNGNGSQINAEIGQTDLGFKSCEIEEEKSISLLEGAPNSETLDKCNNNQADDVEMNLVIDSEEGEEVVMRCAGDASAKITSCERKEPSEESLLNHQDEAVKNSGSGEMKSLARKGPSRECHLDHQEETVKNNGSEKMQSLESSCESPLDHQESAKYDGSRADSVTGSQDGGMSKINSAANKTSDENK